VIAALRCPLLFSSHAQMLVATAGVRMTFSSRACVPAIGC
jgi:hypothetical protein